MATWHFRGILSIHDLSGRSTDRQLPAFCMDILSIHDLSGRSTTCCTLFCESIPFQFTTSRGGRLYLPEWNYIPEPFNSRPLGEVDSKFKQYTAKNSSIYCSLLTNSYTILPFQPHHPLHFAIYPLHFRCESP